MNRIFSKISWIENLKNIPKEDLQSQRMNELLDQIPKKFIPNGYDIKILVKEDGKINAFAVPGGLIILTTSLIKAAKNDEELTFVIGHELGHFAHKDHLRTISRGLATKLTTSIILGSSEILLGISSGFLDLIDNKYSRNQELKADIWGLNIIMHQHGRADGALGFFETISQNKSEFNFQDFLATHPISQTRIKNIKDSNILTRH
ncbi:MAG: Zn-dependent protease with chaperone function [Rickettsiales bacterium]|jgi:Zn-dependent protease with chaperone function